MNSNIGRVSENVLFSVLLTALVVWTGAQYTASTPAAKAPAAQSVTSVASARSMHHS